MSSIAIVSTSAALATVATVIATTLPEVAQAVAPLFEANHELTLVAISILASFPALAVMSMLVATGRN